MNYNSIDEILASGVENMEVILDNSKQTSTQKVVGVNWFTFNNIIANTIYVSGRASGFGFGSSSMHLRLDCMCGAMYYLYREEGTLYNHYRFLKIRWSGYSYSDIAVPSYQLTYDIILWDTGDISFHMVSFPAGYFGSTHSLYASSTYTFTTNETLPDTTFKKTDDGFVVSNNIIDLKIPRWYLIKSNSTYYAIINNTLSEIIVSSLTAEDFLNFGTMEIPSISLLLNIPNPELLCWTNSEPNKPTQGLIIHGTPSIPQMFYYDEKTVPENTVITKAEAHKANNILLTVTFDNGVTWMYYDVATSTWIATASDNEGMTDITIKDLTPEQWATAPLTTTYQFRCVLLSLESCAGSIYLNTAVAE